jgi:hypothetical protein
MIVASIITTTDLAAKVIIRCMVENPQQYAQEFVDNEVPQHVIEQVFLALQRAERPLDLDISYGTIGESVIYR